MIIFAKICKSNNYKGFVLLFVYPAFIDFSAGEEHDTAKTESPITKQTKIFFI